MVPLRDAGDDVTDVAAPAVTETVTPSNESNRNVAELIESKPLDKIAAYLNIEITKRLT